jgi:hypothetical protein
MYKTYVNSFGQLTVYFERNGLLHCAPSDPQNTDYQAYLAWVAEGNVAEEWNQ